MFCKKCGTLIPDDSIFCPCCGSYIQIEETTPLKEQGLNDNSTVFPGNGNDIRTKPKKKKIVSLPVIGAAILCILLVTAIVALIYHNHHTFDFKNQGMTTDNVNTAGNTPDNLLGNGIATIQDKAIYYIKTSGFSNKCSIIAMDLSGEKEKKLYTFDGKISELNVVGDQLYFVGSSLDDDDLVAESNIYLLDLADFSAKSIYTSSNDIPGLYVSEDKIYFSETDNDKTAELFSANLDGSSCASLTKTESPLYDFSVINAHLYYICENNLYQCDLDGSNAAIRYTFSNASPSYCGENSKLYIVDGGDAEGPVVKSMNLDGSGILELQGYSTDQAIEYLNVTDNTVYYIVNTVDENDNVISREICTMNIDGSDMKTIATVECQIDECSICGHWLFYYDTNEEEIMKLDLNGEAE